jgi:hypothetical protein
MTAVAAVGFGVGLVVMLWRYRTTPISAAFVERPETIAWVITLAFSVSFWTVASIPLWWDVWTLKAIPRGAEWTALGFGAVAFFAMLVAPVIVGLRVRSIEIPLVHASTRLRGIQAVAGVLVVLPGVLSIWLHSLSFTRRDYLSVAASDDRAHADQELGSVESFLMDRSALLRGGTILGATVGLATLATGALRNALVAAGVQGVSATLVLAYGAGYTAMLAIVYVPAYLSMQAAGRRILESYLPMQLPDSPTYDEYQQTRRAWEDLLQLKVGPADSFRIGTAVLAPIVTALITVLVGVTI